MAETCEARAERDKAMKDLRVMQLESQSWKEDAASSRAAVRLLTCNSKFPKLIQAASNHQLTQAELTVCYTQLSGFRNADRSFQLTR